MIRKVEYFETKGQDNTNRCVDIAHELSVEGHSYFVVATTRGRTAIKLAERLQGTRAIIVAVTHNVGFSQPNEDQCPQEARQRMEQLGVKVYTGSILTRGIESALMKKHQGVYPAYIVAETLRLFGQGMKVAVEITMEACDSGLIPEDQDVVAIAGTGYGADTVVIIHAKPSNRFLDLKVRQVIAKPL